MPDTEENIEKAATSKPKKSLAGRLLRYIMIFFTALFILILILLVFIQTDFFNKLALNYALDEVNISLAEKESSVSVGSLKGNLFKGLTFSNGSVIVKKDTLLRFDTIQAKYSIWSLLNKEISVQLLSIKKPQINLTKVKDKNDSLKWNLSYLLESEEEDEDTTTSEFDWGIIAEDLNIENGSVRILENKNSGLPIREIQMTKLDTFEFGNFDLTDFNLNLSAKYFPEKKEADIKNISFNTNSDFNINKFSLKAVLDREDSSTSVKDLSLITSRSDFTINELFMKKFEPLDMEDYEEFDDNHTVLNLESRQFNIKDLTFFLPELDFLDSTISLSLIAEGNYGELDFQKLHLNLVNSSFDFKGKVMNLHEPSKLYFDLTGNDIEIDPADTKRNFPGLDIPDYSYLGTVRIPYLTYKGEPEKFDTDFDIRTSAGNADGNAFIDLTQNDIKYKGEVTTTNLDIGKIVKDKTLESNINGKFKADATGFDYKTASGKLDYSINRTKFFGQNISSSEGKLNFNRGNISLNITYNSDAIKTKAEGKINISNTDNISYDLRGTASNLNIAAFTKDNSQTSDLNFSFDVNGQGFDPDNMTGKFNINMSPSTFAEYEIPATPLSAEIDQNGNIRSIAVNTDFAEIKLDGEVNFSRLSEIVSANIDKINADITRSLLPDSLKSTDSLTYTYSAICDNTYFDYAINIKDLAPLHTFTGGDTINFKGNFEGSLSDSCGVFYFVSNGLIREARLDDSLLITDSAKIDVSIKNDLNNKEISKLEASAVIEANKLIVSKMLLDSTMVRADFTESTNKFDIWTQQDSTLKLFTEGSLKDSFTVNFDSLAFQYKNFLITNNNDLIVKYNNADSSQAIEFRKFVLNSLNQKVALTGKYSLTDSSDIKLSASNLDLAKIQKAINDDLDTTNMFTGKIRYLDLEFKGILKHPEIDFSAVSEELKIGSTDIGRLDARLKYFDDDLTSNISFYNKKNTGDFSLVGNVPIILNFSDDNTDSLSRREKVLEKKVDLNAVANNFQLRVFQQLLPYTEDLRGILEGKISLLGTGKEPVLTGKMDVKEGNVYVTLTKMKYGFFVNLSTEGEKLLINNSRIYVPSEESKFISAAGYIDFTGLTLNDLRLEMMGDVKAFDKDNGDTQLGISGDLWVGSGKKRLTLKGNSERFDLTGNLVLVKGNIVFNPFVQEAYNIYSDDFNYGVIIDSLKDSNKVFTKVIKESSDSIFVLKDQTLNPFEQIMYAYSHKDVKREARQPSGKFFYDIIVSTSGNVFLKFIVNEKSQQEFFGEIKTEDLNIYNYVDYTMMGRGTVTLGDNCYYKFFRKFDATGSTTFVGPITNPKLDINAEYKGYASSGTDASGQENLEDVLIDLKVTGDASNPTLTISIDKNGVKVTGADATSDAISFLLFGKFSDQLSFSESSSFGASLGASYLSNIVSSSVEEVLPWLINTNINYVDNKEGSLAQNTDVRFTAAVGDAIVRFGGQIFRGLANTDIVVDYPLNKLLKIDALSNNLIIRFERVYDPFYSDADVTNTNGSRLGGMVYYKFKF